MAFLSFNCLKSYYYLFIFWVLDLIIITVTDLYLFEEIDNHEYLQGIDFIYLSCLNIADLFAGFLVLHTHFTMRTKKVKINEMEDEKKEEQKQRKIKKTIKETNYQKDATIQKPYDLIYNENSIKKHQFIYLFLISLIEFIARSSDLLFLLILKDKMPIRPGEINWLISVDTFARIIFSRLILKAKIYKHHICSLILIIIGLFSMSVCAFKAIAKEELDNWPYFLFIAGKYILLPLEDVINKILLTDEFLLPHYLMFYRGIFNFFMLAILGSSVIIPGIVKFTYFSQFKTENELIIQVIVKVLFTFFSFFKAFSLLKVIDIFSPQHVAFLKNAFTLYQLLKCRLYNKDNVFLMIVDAIFLIVMIFATTVFNEMIIINAWGLNKNTKKGLLAKEKQELQDIRSTNDFSSESDSVSEDKEECSVIQNF